MEVKVAIRNGIERGEAPISSSGGPLSPRQPSNPLIKFSQVPQSPGAPVAASSMQSPFSLNPFPDLLERCQR